MADQNDFMQAAPTFHGANNNQGASPEDFISRMDGYRKSRPAETGEVFVQRVKGFLRGHARLWFEKCLPASETPADLRQIMTDWQAFKAAFKENYFQFVSAKDAKIEWTLIRQENNESTPDFITRLFAAIVETSEMWAEEASTKCHDAVVTPSADFCPELNALLPTAADKAHLHVYNGHTTDTVLSTYNSLRDVDHLVKVAAMGLVDSRLKSIIKELGKEDIQYKELRKRLLAKEQVLQKPGNKPKATVNAVQGSKQEEDEAVGTGAAAIQGGSKKGKGKGKPKKGNPTKPGRKCHLCDSPNHIITSCPQLDSARIYTGHAAASAAGQEKPPGNE